MWASVGANLLLSMRWNGRAGSSSIVECWWELSYFRKFIHREIQRDQLPISWWNTLNEIDNGTVGIALTHKLAYPCRSIPQRLHDQAVKERQVRHYSGGSYIWPCLCAIFRVKIFSYFAQRHMCRVFDGISVNASRYRRECLGTAIRTLSGNTRRLTYCML